MVWVNTWSDEDEKAIIFKRDVEKKHMKVIAEEMGRSLRGCYDRYALISYGRQPDVVIVAPAPAPSRRLSFHERLGIETFVHRQAVLTEVSSVAGKKSEGGWGYDSVNRCWSNNHLFRASVTLAKVLA